MKKPKFTFTMEPRPGAPAKGHFFLSSVCEWRTGHDLDKLMAVMKRDGQPFNLFYVPLPKDADYEIRSYAPQVEGAVWLGAWVPEE